MVALQIEQVEIFPLLHKLFRSYGDANGYKKYRTCFLLRIRTKSGIEGWGECVDWLPTLTQGFRERIIPFLLGKKATDRLRLVKIVHKWHQRAAAGVSMALTEIIAKKAGLSLCDLWGGKWHHTVPVYASFQSYTDAEDWIMHSIRLVEQAASEGFTAMKLKIGGRTIDEDQRHIQAVQESLSGAAQIALDANQSYDAAAVRRWEKWFQQWENVLWLEEPMPMNRVAEYRYLRNVLPIPLAGGENLASAQEFLPILKESALDIVQPDPMHQDGIDGYRNTLQLARDFGVRVSPHAFDGVLSRWCALLTQACLPSWSKMQGEPVELVEWDVMENPFTRLLSVQPYRGTVTIPDEVGLGVQLDQELIQAYLWDGSRYW